MQSQTQHTWMGRARVGRGGWPPDWSLLRGAASSFKPYAALLRLRGYVSFFNHGQVRETFVKNCAWGRGGEC
eukprot:16664-Chlamydomonas_euryale.AAC.2